MRLRLDDRDRLLKVTHPRSVRPAAALAWAASQRSWVEDQLGRVPAPEPFVPGAVFPIEGRDVELHWSEDSPRVPSLAAGVLTCGGPKSAFARRIEQFLRRRALELLSRETGEMAQRAGVRASSVTIGDAKTRWGSCSSSGALRYSWRLVLAPPEARRFVVAHEVAHLKHLNHSPEFRALERELFGENVREAEVLLRNAAPRLRRIGVVV